MEPNQEQLRDRAERYLADVFSDQEEEAWVDLLRTDETARRELKRASAREVALRQAVIIVMGSSDDGAATEDDSRPVIATPMSPLSRGRWVLGAAAACLLGFVVLGAVHLGLFDGDPARTVPIGPPDGIDEVVSVLESWRIVPKTALRREGSRRILSATKQTRLENSEGVRIDLAQGSVLELPLDGGDQDADVALHRGAALVTVKPGRRPSEAFVLATDVAKLEVKGTKFLVNVNRKEKTMGRQLGAMVIAVMLFSGVLDLVAPEGSLHMLAGDTAIAEEGTPPRKAVEGLAGKFGNRYKPITVRCDPSIPSYALPMAKEKISHYADVIAKVSRFAPVNEALLGKNGFTASAWASDDFIKAYKALKEAEVPIFVTSDSVLHLYHLQFDETLKSIEQRRFIESLDSLLRSLDEELTIMARKAGKGAAGVNKARAFTAVALELLHNRDAEEARLKAYRAELASHAGPWSTSRTSMLKASDPALLHALWNAPEWRDRKHPLNPFQGHRREHKAKMLRLLDVMIQRCSSDRFRVKLPAKDQKRADHDLGLALSAQGTKKSAIFNYREDFTQYGPRGHYSQTYPLQRYFKAMMWVGRMTFLAKGGQAGDPGGPFMVSREEARRQTQGACAIALALGRATVGDQRAEEIWEEIYSVTSFFVGLADDLTHREYSHALSQAMGQNYGPGELDEAGFIKAQAEIIKFRKPSIFSGQDIDPLSDAAVLAGKPSQQELNKALCATQGFRLMGQRFVPDSYIFTKLVYPSVGAYKGDRSPETVFTGGKRRSFPRGLDFMALLGSSRAKEHLAATTDDNYLGYSDVFRKLTSEFSEIGDAATWNVNLYWSWLYGLKGLLKEDLREGVPTYMTTPAWRDKQLNAALASWSQLRHDTILYAKQSGSRWGRPRPPKKLSGYVEAVPEFYARLLALTRLMSTVLGEMDVLDKVQKDRLEKTEALLSRLLEIAVKELENKVLSEEDQDFIRGFFLKLKSATAGMRMDNMKSSVIADVHTDPQSGQVLEEGTGSLGLMVVANRMPDGRITLSAGPVFTYYEFKHPVGDRLTDEKWRAMLKAAGGVIPGKMPAFVKSYFDAK